MQAKHDEDLAEGGGQRRWLTAVLSIYNGVKYTRKPLCL